MSKDTIYLVDGTSICYRSFFAIKLSTREGVPTGAVYGFFKTLRKIISQHKPTHVGICFDVSRKTFRQEKFKEYKIQRPPCPDGLRAQIPLIKKLIHLLGVALIEKEGFEADDIIASFSKRAAKDNLSTVIVSPDKDVYQLIDGNRVVVYNPNQEKFLNEDDFVKEFGFAPVSMVDYLSLAGDSADNIPGAKGIGKVGAAKLIKSFATVENIFDNLDQTLPNLREVLIRNRENIFLSKELIKLSFPDLNLTWQDLKIKEPNYTEIYKMFRELEFNALLREIPLPPSNLKIKVREKISLSSLEELKKDKVIFFIKEEQAYVFNDKETCVHKIKLENIKNLLEDEKVEKISYDFKQQMVALGDIAIKGAWFDVKVAAYLINPSFPDYTLPTLAACYLEDFAEISPEAAPCFIYQLYQVLSPKLKEQALGELFFNVEMPLVYVLTDMQRYGVKVDIVVLESLLSEVKKKLASVEEEIFNIAGKKFNLNSPKALRVVLFQELKMPSFKKTKTGYSTNEAVLEKLSSQYEIARFLLEYRHLNKLKTTYILPLMEQVRLKGGRLHAQFNQTSTQTGRLSSSSPNLQSIPVKGEFSSHLRKAFISSFKGGNILCGDYSQIELKILAHFSGEDYLIEAFKKNRDIHRYTASLLFGIQESEVADTQRDLAKKVTYSIIYGMSSYGLSEELKITPTQAQRFIEDYFLRYPKVKDYIQRVYEEAAKDGFVKTILGRKRNLPDFNSPNLNLREFSRRCAINTPIQGSCADIIKVAMVKIYKEFKQENLGAKLIIQIHDELVFDVPMQECEMVAGIVKRNMEESIKLTVPIEVNLKIGRNWAEMKEFGV
ncbi:MAG: DNA polymerase I [Candidatus Omnitrophica bacterium]|nr:DNA polymerase I [Candidatus Omnitrophota bacterium]MBU1133339.1 DNA polymerase I [Candidatus Omnitrophota bacterium]MBU1810625.1 DNA polymerase I [Candidatus Omnitrophota bacterium]